MINSDHIDRVGAGNFVGELGRAADLAEKGIRACAVVQLIVKAKLVGFVVVREEMGLSSVKCNFLTIPVKENVVTRLNVYWRGNRVVLCVLSDSLEIRYHWGSAIISVVFELKLKLKRIVAIKLKDLIRLLSA